MEIEGTVVEDDAWMRKADDYVHINVAELEVGGDIERNKLVFEVGVGR